MKKLLTIIGLFLVLSACSVQADEGYIKMQTLGPAPELENDVWINTSEPLRLADLKGQVVLLDMWTFG